MNETEMSRYITDTFEGVDVVVTEDNSFFFYNPDINLPPDHMFPFATIMTNDINDQFSNLNRATISRLNIGVSKQTFQSLFGLQERPSDTENLSESDDNDSNFDFTVLDQLMPHPVYGRMHWVCVLNPGQETFETKVQPLLEEAYKSAVSKFDRQAARS